MGAGIPARFKRRALHEIFRSTWSFSERRDRRATTTPSRHSCSSTARHTPPPAGSRMTPSPFSPAWDTTVSLSLFQLFSIFTGIAPDLPGSGKTRGKAVPQSDKPGWLLSFFSALAVKQVRVFSKNIFSLLRSCWWQPRCLPSISCP